MTITLHDLAHDDAGTIVGRYRFRHETPDFEGVLASVRFDDGATDWVTGPQLRELVLKHGPQIELVAHEQWDGKRWIATPSAE